MGLEVGPEVGVEAARRAGENLFLLSSLLAFANFCERVVEQNASSFLAYV